MSAHAAAWHDVECASYAADLATWRSLAASHGGPVLDLGCGTGRVALDLAARGHAVTGVDADPELVRVLAARAGAWNLAVDAVAADVRSLDLGATYPLAVAPMQVVQLLGGAGGRAAMLARVLSHLEPGGLLAVALADPFDAVPAGEALLPLPDVLETGGWVLSSTPVDVRDDGDAVAIVRHRQAVSPGGELTEEMGTVSLDTVSATELQEEGAAAGYEVRASRSVAATREYVGSTIVMLEARR